MFVLNVGASIPLLLFLLFRDQDRGQHGRCQDAGDDGEGDGDADVNPCFDEHFYADEGEDECEADLQIAEEFHDAVDREVE